MEQAVRKYVFDGREWDWAELDAYIGRELDLLRKSGRRRVKLALGMVEGREVLDVGCHLGLEAFLLHERGHQVTGVDVDENVLEIAERKFGNAGIRFSRTDGLHLDFPDGSFDCAILLEVLEHSEHPRGLVRELHRVLRPGGHLIVSVPNAASYHTLARTVLLNLKAYYRKMETWPEFATDQRDHYYYWDPFTLYRLLSRQGFHYADHDFSDNFRLVNALGKVLPLFRRISTCFIIKVRRDG
ncbi:MAG TPA: methyltransferase domain-containing protein [Candidatus Glassbacteria bacterium]|nr:methyltransferase domain-containing protein [Candidatus Glassbacteria bacterium]